MAGQASSWLRLDNGLVSLGAMWKPCPSSLIHERWNEKESKILPRDIVAVRLRADPALHSRDEDKLSISLHRLLGCGSEENGLKSLQMSLSRSSFP